MSKKELARVEVLARVKSEQLRVVDAARLMRVSYRQAKRLWRRFREEGAVGLKHRSAGRSSNRAPEAKFRCKVLRLVREKYGGTRGRVGQRVRRGGAEEMWHSVAVNAQQDADGNLVICVFVFHPEWDEPLQVASINSRPQDADCQTPLGCNLDHVAP